ncbi:integrase family protein [Cupriavidus basilensis OR16]|uniref:Integrase family protein n=1 Tax=Cupriavidus basilensis OR16 TaxID=1127483 RepID=H1S801_9BURK|nr:integrase family protein [Cupriavidus basilensis OR16]
MEMKAQRLHSILVKLHRMGVETTGLRVPLAQLYKPLLERFAQRAGRSQYPVIPTRIYQHFLSTCEHDLRVAEGVADALSDYLACVYAAGNPGISAALVTAAAHFGCKDSAYVMSSLVASIRAVWMQNIWCHIRVSADRLQSDVRPGLSMYPERASSSPRLGDLD